ncbi:hypothetical protein [Streptomyces sp. NPDC020597]|uniref:hypothetical protein n=1 Tax=unclassified Streptomyces TaxID=2593676 RepID=UPI00379DF24F
MTVEEAVSMVSLIEELESRETAARARVEELESRIAELTVRLEAEREAGSRLRVTRETEWWRVRFPAWRSDHLRTGVPA